MIITLLEVKIEAADLSMVKVVTDNLENSHKEAGQRPQYNQCQF